MSRYYDRDGSEITIDQWTDRRRSTDEYRRVAFDKVADADISTVWLGLDHSFGFGEGPPLIFETMIFGGPCDQDQWRYSTEAQAIEGHKAAVKKAKMARAAEFGEVAP